MTTGATDTFTQTCDEIIADALANVGAIGPGGDISGKPRLRAHAFRALNRLIKENDVLGDYLWRTLRRDIAITAGTASYTMASDVLNVDDPCNFRLSNQTTSRTQVYAMSLDDYRRLADRTSQGTPSQYVVDRTLSAITVTLWPVPVAAGTLEVQVALRGKDFVLGTDTPDTTTKWLQCIVDGVSGIIAPAYMQPGDAFMASFEARRDRLMNEDNQKLGITFVPFGS